MLLRWLQDQCCLLPGNSYAALSLDYTFGFSNPVPSFSYDQASDTLSCTIPVTTITGIDTNQNSYNSYALSGGVLKFVTGIYNEQSGTFAPGGTITLSGAIPALSINNTSTILLSGGFNSGASLTNIMGGMADDFVASFPTTDSPFLYNNFSIPQDSSGSSNISLTFLASSGLILNNSSNNLVNGYILDTPNPNGNTGGTVSTPIQAAAWLLGSGLLGLAGLRSMLKDRLAIV